MPYAIHLDGLKRQWFFNPSKPQEKVPEVLPENWLGTASQGLPVREIPFYAFPCVVYKHPIRPTKSVVHRNHNHEIVDEELIPTEHLSKVINCDAHKNGGLKDCADCNKILDAALSQGWVMTPYIPEAPETPDVDLYGPRSKK
jgi:hypothetical protein